MTTLFHVSPIINLKSILDQGVRPEYSRGKQRVSWYCDEPRLLWALAHISARYSVPVDRLVIFALDADVETFAKTRWQGVYQSRVARMVEKSMPATDYVS